MLYVLTNSSKPASELLIHDMCFRKVSQEHGGFFVSRTKEGAKKLALSLFPNTAVPIAVRGLTKEELQLLQMNASTGTVKFIFVHVDEETGVVSHHKSIHTIEEKEA